MHLILSHGIIISLLFENKLINLFVPPGTIIDVIVANIRNGGEVANAMSGTYGLARQGY